MTDQILVIVGALIGLALHMRARGVARDVARVLPALALLLAAASRFMSLPLPSVVWPMLTGAAALVAVMNVMR
jgi:hypothetical protein